MDRRPSRTKSDECRPRNIYGNGYRDRHWLYRNRILWNVKKIKYAKAREQKAWLESHQFRPAKATDGRAKSKAPLSQVFRQIHALADVSRYVSQRIQMSGPSSSPTLRYWTAAPTRVLVIHQRSPFTARHASLIILCGIREVRSNAEERYFLTTK